MPVEPHSEYWSKGPIVLLLMRLLLWEAGAERAKRQGTTMVFTSALGLRIVFAFGVSIFAWTMLKEWSREESWVLITGGLTIFAFALAWPSTLWLTDTGIEQRRWWRPKVVIPWNE